MARNRSRRSVEPARNQQEHDEQTAWFVSADSHLGGVASWDIKTQLFVRTLLALLGSGRNVGLYSAWHGEALSIRVYDGDRKHDIRIRDAVQWDEAWERVADILRGQGIDVVSEG